ncbi:hypothetical protein HK405_001605, partial [Cladochytrium tenue]
LTMWYWIAPGVESFTQQNLLGGIPSLLQPVIYWIVRRKMLRRYELAGLARHSRAELLSLADRQLDALAALMAGSNDAEVDDFNDDGDDDRKPPVYVLGTAAPTTLDCAVFGILSQLVLAGNARVQAVAASSSAAAASRGGRSRQPPPPGHQQQPLGAAKVDTELARAVTPGMVQYVRRFGRAWFPDFASGVSYETWRWLEADARAAQAARQQ